MIALSGDQRMKRTALAAVLLVSLVGPAIAGELVVEDDLPIDELSAESQFDIGVSRYEEQDYAAARELFRLAAEQGHTEAQNKLGVMYADGEGVLQDYAEAVRWYRKAAEQGYAYAESNLGYMYDGGQGVLQDYAEAVRWYRKAAEQGLPESQYNLGLQYGNGEGVPQNYIQAHMWFNLAAAQGLEVAHEARDNFAKRMTPADVSKAQAMAREWMEKHQEGVVRANWLEPGRGVP